MTKNYLEYKTTRQAHARVNQLQGLLSLPLTAAATTIDGDWDEIARLEDLLAAKPTTPAAAPKEAKVDPPIAKVAAPQLTGLARAAAATREHRTQKPTVTGDLMPETGWGRAARATAKAQGRNQ